MTAINVIAIILGATGTFFMFLSFIGVITFPDFLTRLHAQGVGDSIGLFFILVAMMLCTGLKIITIKYFLIFMMVFFTNPMGTSILLQAVSHKSEFRSSDDEEDKEEAKC